MLGQRGLDKPVWRMLPIKNLMLWLARPPKLGEFMKLLLGVFPA